jgi:hypothetical protein
MTIVRRSLLLYLGGLALLGLGSRGVSAQDVLDCPFEGPIRVDTGGGCPMIVRYPFGCGCTPTSFHPWVCGGFAYGNPSGSFCTYHDCTYYINYSKVCAEDVEEPCTTCQRNGGSAPAPPVSAGLPVSLTTGAVFFSQADAANGDVTLTRSYNSARAGSTRHGAFGPGWNASFEMRVRASSESSFEVRGGDGSAQYFFDENQDGVFEAALPSSKDSWLVVLPEGGYRRDHRGGAS